MDEIFSQPSAQQIKSNLWAGATIWANLFIVLIIALIVGAVVSNVNGGIVSFFPYWQMIAQIVSMLIAVFAVWLGVRSVLKVTPIDEKNNFYVGLWAVLVPIVLQVGLIIFGLFSGSGRSVTMPGWIILISNLVLGDLTIFVSCIYFLKTDSKNKISGLDTNINKITLFFILFLAALFVLVAWVLPYIGFIFSTAPAVLENQEVVLPKNAAGSETHDNKTLGLRFTYPKTWGKVEETVQDYTERKTHYGDFGPTNGKFVHITFPDKKDVVDILAYSKNFEQAALASSPRRFKGGIDSLTLPSEFGDYGIPYYVWTDDGKNRGLVVIANNYFNSRFGPHSDSYTGGGGEYKAFSIQAYFDNPTNKEFSGFEVGMPIANINFSPKSDSDKEKIKYYKKFYQDIEMGNAAPEVLQRVDEFLRFIKSFSFGGITSAALQTYQNKFYGFEFKYPAGDKINEWGPGKGSNFPVENVIFVQKPNKEGGADNIFGIVLPDGSYIKNLGESYTHFIFKIGVCGGYATGKVERSSQDIGIGSYSGKKVTEIVSDKGTQFLDIFYCIAHPKNPLIIFNPQGTELLKQDQDFDFQTFNQILASFKFIDVSPSK